MGVKTEIIDFTILRRLTNKIDPDRPLELKLIEYYSYYPTDQMNTIRDFTNHVLSEKYFKIGKYEYNELRTFYNTKGYLNIVLKFIGFIDYLVCKKVGCSFENVRFGKIVESNEKLLVEMIIDVS